MTRDRTKKLTKLRTSGGQTERDQQWKRTTRSIQVVLGLFSVFNEADFVVVVRIESRKKQK